VLALKRDGDVGGSVPMRSLTVAVLMGRGRGKNGGGGGCDGREEVYVAVCPDDRR
jgi:hypothetical protein